MSLSLRAKANIAFFLALATLATMGGFSWRESRRLAEQARWVTHTRNVLDASALLRAKLGDAGTARRSYLLQGDAKQIDLFDQACKEALVDFEALRKLTADNPAQQLRLKEIEPILQSRMAILKASMALRQRNPDDRREQDNYADQAAPLATQFVDLIREFEGVEKDLLQKRSADAQASDRRATSANEVLGFSAFLFLIVAGAALNREITRGTGAEHAVAEQRKLLESILNSCGDAVVAADKNGKFILRNPAAERIYGGRTVVAISEDLPQILGLYREDGVTPFALQDLPLMRTIHGESLDGVEVYVRPAGQKEGRYYVAAGRPLLDDEGERAGGVVVLHDVTQQKRDNERLSAALFESERSAHERSRLNKLTELFQSAHSVAEACKIVEALSPAIFDMRPGAVFLTNSSRNLVELAANWGACSSSKQVFGTGDCWALRLGKIHPGGDVAIPLRCSHQDEAGPDSLCVPLTAQGEAYGVLYIEHKPALPDASPESILDERRRLQLLATAVAERISLAVVNLNLREVLRNQSIRDPLTGLFNRRYLEESLNREIQRAIRTGRTVSFAMLDLDHFKQFNDSFGHQAGDLLLKEAAAVIKGRIRAGDLACRYGGEEFALVLSDTDAEGARKCVDNLREAIKGISVQYRGQTLGHITMSAGIAAFPLHGENPETLIQIADQALYRAKKSGRDCVCDAHDSNTELVS